MTARSPFVFLLLAAALTATACTPTGDPGHRRLNTMRADAAFTKAPSPYMVLVDEQLEPAEERDSVWFGPLVRRLYRVSDSARTDLFLGYLQDVRSWGWQPVRTKVGGGPQEVGFLKSYEGVFEANLVAWPCQEPHTIGVMIWARSVHDSDMAHGARELSMDPPC